MRSGVTMNADTQARREQRSGMEEDKSRVANTMKWSHPAHNQQRQATPAAADQLSDCRRTPQPLPTNLAASPRARPLRNDAGTPAQSSRGPRSRRGPPSCLAIAAERGQARNVSGSVSWCAACRYPRRLRERQAEPPDRGLLLLLALHMPPLVLQVLPVSVLVLLASVMRLRGRVLGACAMVMQGR